MTKTTPKPLNLRPAEVAPTLDYRMANDAAALICPNCGDQHLHPSAPREVEPSRWDNRTIIVPFDCEACDAALVLEIGAHKGNTFLSWRVGIKPFPEPL